MAYMGFHRTNPDLKEVFAEPARPTVLKLAQKYPAARAIANATEEDLRKALIEAGARNSATRAARELKHRPSELVAPCSTVTQKGVFPLTHIPTCCFPCPS